MVMTFHPIQTIAKKSLHQTQMLFGLKEILCFNLVQIEKTGKANGKGEEELKPNKKSRPEAAKVKPSGTAALSCLYQEQFFCSADNCFERLHVLQCEEKSYSSRGPNTYPQVLSLFLRRT